MQTPHPNANITAAMNRQTSVTREEDEEVKPYVVVAEIGKGSFATVYKGYHQDNHKQVAIKTVSRSKLTTKLFENLQSEIEILKALSHRHITRLIDIVRAEKNIYLIMEYCAGGDLTNYIKKRGRVEGLEYIPSEGAAPQYYPHPRAGGLDEIVVRSFLRQLARALKFLRQKNLIHRDIKPQNLLLNPVTEEEYKRGHPIGVPVLKIADFGFARSLPNAMMAETLCGSPLYMAPEILRYEKYDAKADLWSVGAVLYEMAVGKPPFRAQNHIELLKKIDHSKGVKFPDEDPPRTGAEELKAVPPDVKLLIRSLLKRKPVERATFEEFFKSMALAKSKFPRPREPSPTRQAETDEAGRVVVPEHHNVIPPEVLDPTALIPPSKFNFRKREVVTDSGGIPGGPSSPLGKPAHSMGSPSSGAARLPPVSGPLSTEGSIIPGETEEDGQLRREYVLVGDTRAVEFNRAVDEIAVARTRPLRDHKYPQALASDDPPYSPLESPVPGSSNTTFPPLPNVNMPALSSSPSSVSSRTSNPLTRALNIASKKLFGSPNSRSSPHYREYTNSSPRRQQLITGKSPDEYTERDPMEEDLLANLEDLAQKTDVLTNWADEMYEFVKAVPQKPLPDPSKFEKREGEPDRQAMKRKNADIQAEYNAMACVALYMLLMSFSQKGIDKLRNFHEHMKMRDPEGEFVVSEGFEDALTWFKEHFMKCNDRASLVKTWLPSQYTGAPHYLDQMIYDHALSLSRNAARKELLDQATGPDECEKLYEESLWCLYALQDDLLQEDNPFLQEDRATIATWIKRTKLRLVRCRVRMGMNDRDRIRDARADRYLDDVERIPPPWEPAAPTSSSPGANSNVPISARGTPPTTTPFRS